jgi:hypothetical protein
MSKHLEDRAGASPDGTRNALLFPFQTNGDQSSYKEEIDGEVTQQRGTAPTRVDGTLRNAAGVGCNQPLLE